MRRNWHICWQKTATQGQVPEPTTLVLLLVPKATALPRDVAVAHPSLDSFDALLGAMRMTAREIDIHTLPSMLTALRLPGFHKLWAEIATRADTEGRPAARFVAVSAEYALPERDMRRLQRAI